MRLVQRYSLQPFMTPRRFFYPRVVIEFYHTMTSRREPNPTAIHVAINGRLGILLATDIAATFNLPMVLTRPITDSGPIPLTGRWFIYYPGTRQPGLSCSRGSFPRVCSLSIIFCGPIYFRSSILYRGEELFWRLYTTSPRAFGSALPSSS